VTVRAYVDWGEPRPAEWVGPRETLTARLPASIAEAVRDRARNQGVSVSVMVTRLLESALDRRPAAPNAAHADLITTLFD
jgi:hypothetical protein